MGNINTSIEHLVSIYQDVANAIRSKAGTSVTITPDDFAQQILAIPSGGGGSEEWVPYSINILNSVSNTTILPTFSFTDDTYYLYDSEEEAFTQQDPTKPIDTTNLGNNIFIRIIEGTTNDTILFTISDRKVLVNFYLNDTPLEIVDDTFNEIKIKTSSKLVSLDNLTFKFDTLDFDKDTVYDDLLISNSDEANYYPTAILSRGAKASYDELAKDADTNYVLDQILGINDPDEENRTFTALENYSYDNLGTVSWDYKEKVDTYFIYLKANNDEEIYLGQIANTQYLEDSDSGSDSDGDFSYNILNNPNANLSDFTTDDSLQLNVQCTGFRFFDMDNYTTIYGPVGTINNSLVFNQDYTVASYTPIATQIGTYFNTYNSVGDFVEKLEFQETSIPIEKFGDATIAKIITKENNKITSIPNNSDISSFLNLSSFTYQVEVSQDDSVFTLGEDNWYISKNFNGIEVALPGYAYAKIIFNSRKATTVKLLFQQYTRDSFTSTVSTLVSKIDTTLSRSADADASSLLFTTIEPNNTSPYDATKPGMPYAAWLDIPAGESFITLKFRKQSTSYSGSYAALKFKVEEEHYYWHLDSDSCIEQNFKKVSYNNTGSFIYNNKIYSQSDWNISESPVLYSYDLATNEITTKPVIAKAYHTGILGDNSGRYYAFETDSVLRIYDIETATLLQSYSAKDVFGYSYFGYYLRSCSIGTKIYVAYSSASKYLYVFDVATGLYSIINNAINYPCTYTPMIPVNNKIYFINTGIGGSYSSFNSLFLVFDINNNNFYYEGAMPQTRWFEKGGCCCINNRYIVMLGNDSVSSQQYQFVFIYDTLLKEVHRSRNNLFATYNGFTIKEQYCMDVVCTNNILYRIGGYIQYSTTANLPVIFKTVLCNSRELLPEADDSND